ncbi:MAG: hypothetical protein C0392_04990 [Syntrophus sp. (in: bacteria)]|nr:hypothetical protein [Syntrophus sp. (in: bacteria)]
MNISFVSLGRKALIALIPLVIMSITFLFYGFANTFVYYPLLCIFYLVFIYIDYKNAFLLSITLFIVTLLVNGLLGLLKIDDRIYYRAHERLTVYNHEIEMKSYKKNVDITVMMPFGDACAVGNEKNIDIEPRRIRFKTDSLGFRNDSDYKGQEYVLVGDSFTVGNDTSQEDILMTQLKEKYHKDTYGLAYPGGIPEYVKYILYFQKKVKTDFKVLLFVYEGNDFPETYSRKRLTVKKHGFMALRDRYKAIFEETVLYKYTYSLISKYTRKSLSAEVFVVNGRRMADFGEYIDAARRDTYRLPDKVVPMLSLVRNRIDHIFFIPTKYRVYYSFLEKNNQKPLPNAQWEAIKALSKKLDIGCTDLTGPMIDVSKILLKEDKYTFWKDDSHWNKYGIGVAAKVVSDYIDSKKGLQ